MFEIGDRVTIVSGSFYGEQGEVVSNDEFKVKPSNNEFYNTLVLVNTLTTPMWYLVKDLRGKNYDRRKNRY